MKIQTYELKRIPIIRFDNEQILSLNHKSIFTECGIDPESDVPIEEQEPHPLPDRRAIDDVVFDALGLDEEERKDVYRAVCRLVWDRISKAKSQKKKRR